METLKAYVDYARNKDIKFNYTMNATCMGNKEFTEKGISELYRFLCSLQAIGISDLTVALPSVMELVKMTGLNFKIKTSVLGGITNVSKAMSYKSLGADKIVIDESINRQFHVIRNICNAFGPAVEIIVNVVCYKNCIYRPFHYNQMSHDISSECKGMTYYSHRCLLKRMESAANIMRLNWIRPEDIKYYNEIGIQYFKIQGRQAAVKGDIFRTVESYMREEYDGNLLELLDAFLPTSSFHPHIPNKKLDNFIQPFIENDNFCSNDCHGCQYCDLFFADKINKREVERLYSIGESFIREVDSFIQIMPSLKLNNTDNNSSATPEK